MFPLTFEAEMLEQNHDNSRKQKERFATKKVIQIVCNKSVFYNFDKRRKWLEMGN